MKNKKAIELVAAAVACSFALSSCGLIFSGLFTSSSQAPSGDSSLSLIGKVTESQGVSAMPSLGTTKLLVVKVQIPGAPSSALGGFDTGSYQSQSGAILPFTANWNDLIYDAFFGNSSDTGWESVSSFYEKSSYGKLHIEGTVAATVYQTPKTYDQYASELAGDDGTKAQAISDSIAQGVYDKYFSGGTTYDNVDYDSNGDGVVDGIWMVYDTYYETSRDSVFQNLLWAYVTWYSQNNNTPAQNGFSVYAWASKWFLSDGAYFTGGLNRSLLADSHTFIHETGHMMGLDDYYDTEQVRSPAGALMMMDHNVYDQDPYSKYLLGWIDPRRISATDLADSDRELTLTPFEETGDALIVDLPGNSGWVGEEYVILCYWTPTGLNQQDAENVYGNNSVNHGFTQPGILAYHVDSSFAKYKYNMLQGQYVSDGMAKSLSEIESDWNSGEVFVPAYSNATAFSNGAFDVTADDVLLGIVDAQNLFVNMSSNAASGLAGTANDNYMFHEDDRYDSDYVGVKPNGFVASFHASGDLGVVLDFGSQSSSGASIRASRED